MAGVYTDQRLNLSKLGKACGRKAKVSNRTRETWPSGIIGGFGKRKPWWDCEPVLQSKEQERKPPHLQRGAPDFYPSNANFDLNRRASPRP
jgi:hypothetical protein